MDVGVQGASGALARDAIDTLNDLVETCRDGEEGFEMCAQRVADPAVADRLLEHSRQCARSAEELQRIVVGLGGEPVDRRSATGAVHQAWLGLRTALDGDDERAVLDECERGEDAAVSRYRDALEQVLPADVHEAVERQYRGVLANHDEVRRLRDGYVARPAH